MSSLNFTPKISVSPSSLEYRITKKNNSQVDLPKTSSFSKEQLIAQKAFGFIKNELFDNQHISFKFDAWNNLTQYFYNWVNGTIQSAKVCLETWKKDVSQIKTWSFLGFVFSCAWIYYLLKMITQGIWSSFKIAVRTLCYLLYSFVGVAVYLVYNPFKSRREKIEQEEKNQAYLKAAQIPIQKGLDEGSHRIEKAESKLLAFLDKKEKDPQKLQKLLKDLAEAALYDAKAKARASALNEAIASGQRPDINEVMEQEDLRRTHLYEKLREVYITVVRTDLRNRLHEKADALIDSLNQVLLDEAVDEYLLNIRNITTDDTEIREAMVQDLEKAFSYPIETNKTVRETIKENLPVHCPHVLKSCNDALDILQKEIEAIKAFKRANHEGYDPKLLSKDLINRYNDFSALWSNYNDQISKLGCLLALFKQLGVDPEQGIDQSISSQFQWHLDHFKKVYGQTDTGTFFESL